MFHQFKNDKPKKGFLHMRPETFERIRWLGRVWSHLRRHAHSVIKNTPPYDVFTQNIHVYTSHYLFSNSIEPTFDNDRPRLLQHAKPTIILHTILTMTLRNAICETRKLFLSNFPKMPGTGSDLGVSASIISSALAMVVSASRGGAFGDTKIESRLIESDNACQTCSYDIRAYK